MRDRLVGRQHERGLRRERRARDRHAEGAGDVPGREIARRPDVEHDAAVGRVDGAERRLGAEERPAVERDDAVHVRRPRRRRVAPVLDELVLAPADELERAVEPPLEADRRGRLRAHACAAERARDVARVDLDAVRQLEQARAGSRRGRASPRSASDARSGRAASPMSSESPVITSHGSSPRERSSDGEAAVLGPVPGRVEDADHDLAERDLLAVRERLERVLRLGGGMDGDGDAVLEREPPVPGDVVGVRVRLEDARDADAAASRPPRGTARSRMRDRRPRPHPRTRRRSGRTRSRDRR